jgi:hypothetical protein
MGENSIFSVFSNIWSSVRLKIPPQFQASWWQRMLTLNMAIEKKVSFSFYLSQCSSVLFKSFIDFIYVVDLHFLQSIIFILSNNIQIWSCFQTLMIAVRVHAWMVGRGDTHDNAPPPLPWNRPISYVLCLTRDIVLLPISHVLPLKPSARHGNNVVLVYF